MSSEACNPKSTKIIPNDVEMMSPSKLAAQRIYSSARNHISFHSALQCSSDSLAQLGSPTRQDSPNERREEQSPLQPSIKKASPTFTLNPEWSFTEKPDVDLRRLLEENERQFKLVQQQIDLLRLLIVQLSQTVGAPREATPLTPVAPTRESTETAKTTAEKTVERADEAKEDKAKEEACTVEKDIPNEVDVPTWQLLLFAAVFLVGLLRVIEWLVEKIATFVSDQLAPKSLNLSASLSEKSRSR